MTVLEEQHLFPVLRKHKDMKDLVRGAVDDNKETKSLLADLEGTPRDSEEFGKKVAILRKTFQQHVRDEKKELLPAIVKALSDEEAASVIETMDGSKAEIEETRDAEAEQRRTEARKEPGRVKRPETVKTEHVKKSVSEAHQAESRRSSAPLRERQKPFKRVASRSFRLSVAQSRRPARLLSAPPTICAQCRYPGRPSGAACGPSLGNGLNCRRPECSKT